MIAGASLVGPVSWAQSRGPSLVVSVSWSQSRGLSLAVSVRRRKAMWVIQAGRELPPRGRMRDGADMS
jgi:hypothetical protein